MRRGRFILAAIAAVVFTAAVAAGAYVYALGPPPLGRHFAYSRLVFDGNGRVVHAYATPQGRWRFRATVDDVDPRFLQLLFAYEDKRFYQHHGVDLRALGRAAFQWVTSGHVVSGGSTLTMQVARLLEPRRHRTIEAKLRQIVRAIELEMTLNKKQILSLYLTLAPYGGNLEGIRAASLAYFGKEPRKLTLAQAALLVALPQSPERRRPDRYPQAAREARNRVLERALAAEELSAEQVAHAEARPVPHERKQLRMLTPRAGEKTVAAHPDRAEFRLGKRRQMPPRELDATDARRAGPAPVSGE